MLVLVAACHEPGLPDDTEPADPVSDPSVEVTLGGVQTCLYPERRTEKRFDLQLGLEQDVGAELWGGGAAVADLDGDLSLDILLPGLGAVYYGSRQGYSLEEVPVLLPAASGATPADVDGDGDFDVYVNMYDAADVFLENVDGVLVDATAEHFPMEMPADASQSASFRDFDRDGDLDLYVAVHGGYPEEGGFETFDPADDSRLFENLGDGTFAEITDRLPEDVRSGYGFVGGWRDFDLDGRDDLYAVNDFGKAYATTLAYNRPEGFVADDGSAGLNVTWSNMGVSFGDLDEDDYVDVLVMCWERLPLLISEPVDDRVVWFDHAAERQTVLYEDQVSWGGELADLDNDGDLDAWVVLGAIDSRYPNLASQRDVLFLQDATGSFTEVGAEWGVNDPSPGRALVVADLNRDGWPDGVRPTLVGSAKMFTSRCGTEAWLRVSLSQAGMNRHAIGAEVRVFDGERRFRRWIDAGGTSVNSGGPPEAMFGLADAERVDIEVRWPDGLVSWVHGVETRQAVHLERR